MKFSVKSCLMLAVVSLAAAFSSSVAQAQQGFGFRSAPWWGYQGYGYANRKTIPYFALHPPVYYSHPVARPYGYSPFALPPGMQPAELKAASKPEMLINPHFKPKKLKNKEESKEDKPSAVGPTAKIRIIENPFYRPAGEKAKLRLVSGQ